jgi:hypothetical protein
MDKLKTVLVIVMMLICANVGSAAEKNNETTSQMRVIRVNEYITLCDTAMQHWQTDYTDIEREDMTVGEIVAVKIVRVNNTITSIQIVRR